MPINVNNVINNMSAKLMDGPFMRQIIKNPICTAIVITAILCLIIYFIDPAQTFKNVMRIGVYSFLTITVLIFIQNKFLIEISDKKHADQSAEKVFEKIPSGGNFDGMDAILNSGGIENYTSQKQAAGVTFL